MPRRPWIARASLWLPPLAYMALIFYLSSQSDPLPEISSYVWDKLLHTLEYAGLAALLCRAFLGEGLGWRKTVVAAVLVAAAYGASDEYHQMSVPLRNADPRDWLVDLIGASLGAVGYLSVDSAFRRNNPMAPGSRKDREPKGDSSTV